MTDDQVQETVAATDDGTATYLREVVRRAGAGGPAPFAPDDPE